MTLNVADAVKLHKNHGGTLKHQAIADKYGITYHSWRHKYRTFLGMKGANHTNNSPVPQNGAQSEITPPQNNPPTHALYPIEWNDQPIWNDWKRQRVNKNDVTALLVYDLHIPDHSSEALKMLYNLAFVVQPEVIVFGGDMFDFDALSTFQQHVRRVPGDVFEEIIGVWDEIIDHLGMQCRSAKIIAFGGNHERRRKTFYAANAFIYYTAEQRFVEIVRSRKRVWWLPETEETTLGDLFIKHGERYGENAAKNTLKQLGWSASVAQGHSHRPSTYTQRSNNTRNGYTVTQATCAGCHCNIPPAYQVNRKGVSTWLHGAIVAHVRLDTEFVDLQNVLYHPDPDESGALCAYYGQTKITSSARIGYDTKST